MLDCSRDINLINWKWIKRKAKATFGYGSGHLCRQICTKLGFRKQYNMTLRLWKLLIQRLWSCNSQNYFFILRTCPICLGSFQCDFHLFLFEISICILCERIYYYQFFFSDRCFFLNYFFTKKVDFLYDALLWICLFYLQIPGYSLHRRIPSQVISL